MEKSVRAKGIPVPSGGELLIMAALGVCGWWVWSEYSGLRQHQQSVRPNVVERIQSMEALVAEGVDALDEIVPILSNTDVMSRREAARALGEIGAPARRILPALRESVRDNDARVRAAAIMALVRIDPEAPELAEEMKTAATDDNPFVRESAHDAVRSLGISILRQLAQDPRTALREDAILRMLKEHQARPEEILLWMRDVNPLVARCAFESMQDLGDKADAAVPEAIRRLQSEDVALRLVVLSSFHTLGPKGAEAVPALAELLSDKSPHVAQLAANALYFIGPASVEALPAIVAQIRAQGWRTPQMLTGSLIDVLGNIGTQAAPAVPLLLEIFSDPRVNEQLRIEAIVSIAKIGAPAPDLIVPLRKGLADPSFNVRQPALLALAAMKPKDAELLPDVLKTLRHQDRFTRQVAAWTIGDIVGDRPEMIEALIAALRDDEILVRCAAAKALGRLGQSASSAAPALQSALASIREADKAVMWSPPSLSFSPSRSAENQTLAEIISEAILAISTEAPKSQTP